MSALGISVSAIQWGSSSSDSIYSTVEYASTDSYAPNFYIGYTNAPLVLNRNQVNVPTLFAYIYATPTTSTGGGACVLNGSTISLSDGSSVPVQDLRPGMKTLSYDVNTAKELQNGHAVMCDYMANGLLVDM